MSEIKKMLAVKDQSQAVGEFLEWLSSKGYVLGEWVTRHKDTSSEWTEMVMLVKPINEILAEYFEIDLNKIEAERQALLDEIRAREASA